MVYIGGRGHGQTQFILHLTKLSNRPKQVCKYVLLLDHKTSLKLGEVDKKDSTLYSIVQTHMATNQELEVHNVDRTKKLRKNCLQHTTKLAGLPTKKLASSINFAAI